MKIKSLLLLGVLIVCSLTGCDLGKTRVHPEVRLIDFDKNQLVAHSTAIVAGEVISSESQDDFMNFPATDYKIKVTKVYKGNPGSEVEVRTTGGENSEMIVEASDEYASFEVGEAVVLFLTDDKGDRPDRADFGYYVVGQYQGKLVEANGELRNRKFTFDAVNFEQELKQIEAVNKLKNIQSDSSANGTK